MMEPIQFHFNLFREHCYLLKDSGANVAIIDPGACSDSEQQRLTGALEQGGLHPVAILLTHAHFDHIYAVKLLQDRYDIPVYMHPDEIQTIEDAKINAPRFGMPVPDCSFRSTPVSDGETIQAGGLSFEVITTPGHTPGGVCYLCREHNLIFTGDTLFAGAIGRTDLNGGDYDKEIVSIMDKLMALDSSLVVYPGHGCYSSIGYERTNNPFLEPFNNREETFAQAGISDD